MIRTAMDANTTPPRNGANAQPSSPLLPDGSPGILHELAALVGSEPTDDDAAGHIEQPHTDIARVAAPLDAAVPAEATAPAPAAPALQPEMESAAVHAPADSTADPGPAGRIGQEPQLAGPAVSNDLSDQRPGNDLIEVLEELCRERGLDFTAIDAVIRRRLAAVPDALRFRPGFGAGVPLCGDCQADVVEWKGRRLCLCCDGQPIAPLIRSSASCRRWQRGAGFQCGRSAAGPRKGAAGSADRLRLQVIKWTQDVDWTLIKCCHQHSG